MKKKFIALSVPSRGPTDVRWAGALMNLQWPLNYGQVCDNMVTGPNSRNPIPVDEARNQCVANMESFESDAREVYALLWVDDDVFVDPAALLKLWSLNRPIASGCYFTKTIGSHPIAFPEPGCGPIEYVPDALIDAGVVGLGLCLVKMEVYRKMKRELDLGRDARGNIAYHRYTGPESARMEVGCAVSREGEDAYFCRRAAEVGYRPVVDCSRYTLGWHYDLNSGRMYPERQFKQRLAGEPVVWETNSGPMKWKE